MPDMGDSRDARQPPGPEGQAFRPLVAFDFDGTLTDRDSFTTFLAWRAGPKYAAAAASLAPAAIGYVFNRDRERLKAAAVRRFLAGMTRAELESAAQAFATERGRGLLRPDAVRAWRRWQGDGARVLIVTASPEIVVAPIARALGAHQLIGTRLAFDDEDRVTGALDGANCRGPEKVRRLEVLLGPSPRLAAAYGDTRGDREMLAIAEMQGFKVFRERPTN